MKAIENKQFLCPENKFGKCLLSPFLVYLKSGKSGRNFCANPVSPVPAGFDNSKSGAPLVKLGKLQVEKQLTHLTAAFNLHIR